MDFFGSDTIEVILCPFDIFKLNFSECSGGLRTNQLQWYQRRSRV